MSLNDTVSAERVHIGFFGLRNAGKSSLVNAVTGQSLSVVSEIKGTTTDPVKKAMELLPLGPVVIIDTPGLDDSGALGDKRVQRTWDILAKTDIAVLVTDAREGLGQKELELIGLFNEKKLPYIIAYNKCDTVTKRPFDDGLYVSAKTGENVNELKERLGAIAGRRQSDRRIIADLLSPGDIAVLVMPIDESAPRGRLILPQQQTMREILDAGCAFAACQPGELKATLAALSKKPRIVVTDSQAFAKVASDTPRDIPLTSFSILFARYKGELSALVEGAKALEALEDGSHVLIAEGCTHHRQCNDIGTVQLPKKIREFCGKSPEFHFTSGGEFPRDLSKYSLIVHCGGCMLNGAEMKSRIEKAVSAGVPIVNYGVALACFNGIMERALLPLNVKFS